MTKPDSQLQNNEHLQAEFLASTLRQIHPLLHQWYTHTELQTNLAPEINATTLEYFTPEFSSGFASYFSELGIASERFAHRLLEVSGRRLITGIRFLGGDAKRPFVEVARVSQPLENNTDCELFSALLRREFSEFAPSRWRIFQASHLPYQFDGYAGDLRVLAGLLGEIRNLPMPSNAAQVELKPATSGQFYPRYVALYQQLYQERPWLPDVARIETLEDIEQHIKNGKVFEVFVDRQWAGLTIACRDQGWGVRGWLMVEIVLEAQFRGQNLAVTVQRLLAQHLENNGKDCLFGTIGAINLPMQKTATRVGRADLGGYFWVDL